MNGMPPLIAIVEDEQSVRTALARLLRALGLQTRSFPSCTAFLHPFAHRRPDCMILDLHMPGMSGLELLREIDARGARVPTIIITAHDEPDARRRCLEAGAVAYLRKPFDHQALLDAIALALGTCPDPGTQEGG